MKAKAYQNNGMKTAANAAQQGGRDQDPRHTGQEGDKNKVDPSRKGYDQGSRQDQAGKNPMGGERNR